MKNVESPLRVAVVGAAGRMGMEVVRALSGLEDVQVVAAIDRVEVGKRTADLIGRDVADLPIEEALDKALDRTGAQVVVDFTNGTVAGDNALVALARGAAPVIGASGVPADKIEAIRKACSEKGVPAIIVPNFAIGGVLMMHFAQLAARWMPSAEIVEMHHDQKLDAPSGTSLRTAEMIAAGRAGEFKAPETKIVHAEGARGALVGEVPIHSVRLKGLVAHQRVLFGGVGELLTISHDSLDRKSFMEGVKLAVREVRTLDGLAIGLDQIMFRA